MRKLNYAKLMAKNPSVEGSPIVNQLGQNVEFYENPDSPERPVIAAFHGLSMAFETDFFDSSDFYTDSDYNPVVINSVCKCAFEI